MTENIYDDPEFFARYTRLPRQTCGLDGAPEWPVVRAMLPDLKARRVLDLGCGFGWFGRWAREHGAASILGLDISERMLDRAKRDTADPAITYRMADLDRLELPKASFDIAYSALAFHYVEDFARLVGVIHAALVPGGSLVFTIEHPIYMAAAHPHWVHDEAGRKTWPVNSYAVEGARRTDWLGKGVRKYHRTIGTTVDALIDAGFTVRRLREFAPTAAQVAANPELAEELERPMFLVIAAEG